MEKREKKIGHVFIIAVCAAILLAACGLFGSKRSDAVIIDYDHTEHGLIIRVGVAGSAGHIRSMRLKEKEGDALVEFYPTFGINNPKGAKDEFVLDVSEDCERILFRTGKHSFRTVLEKNILGEWVNSGGEE